MAEKASQDKAARKEKAANAATKKEQELEATHAAAEAD